MRPVCRIGATLGLVALTGPALACELAPAPVLTLDYASRYTGDSATRDRIDAEAEAAAKAALKPLDGFIRDLADASDAMRADPDPASRAARADCILAQMTDWAGADALTGLATQTAQLTIGSRLAAFGLVALQARAHGTADTGEVAAWLARRMRAQMDFWETAPQGATRGNLRAWAALAGAATAALTDDPVIRAWATWSTVYVTCTAAPDGSLPREMERGTRALQYQLHALAPLVTATLLLEDQGMPVLSACGSALDLAVLFALSDLDSGARTAGITGQPQTLTDGTDPLEPFQLAFLEAYLRLPGDPGVKAMAEGRAAPLRPLGYSKLGGDQTQIWGAGRN